MFNSNLMVLIYYVFLGCVVFGVFIAPKIIQKNRKKIVMIKTICSILTGILIVFAIFLYKSGFSDKTVLFVIFLAIIPSIVKISIKD